MSDTANPTRPVAARDEQSSTRDEQPPERVRRDDRPPPESRPEPSANKPPGPSANKPADDDKDAKEAAPKSRWPLIILGIVVLLTILGGVIYWFMTRGLESTDDAYTEGNAISIAPQVSGYVTELDVNDNSVVKAGQVMFKIDPRDYVAARDQARANRSLAQSQLAAAKVNLEVVGVRAPAGLAQAQAQLAQAQANQDQAQQNYKRLHSVDPRATTQTNIDQANAQLKSETATVSAAQANLQTAALVPQTIQTAEDQVKQAQAQVEQAEAALSQAEVKLSYTVVHAPQDGRVTQRNVDLGTYVQAGQQSFYVVTPQVWIVANFKETQLDRMRPGQPVAISIDSYSGLNLRGHVDSIQQGSGSRFSAFPAENATGNFVKIVRRVPVKIAIDSGLPDGMTLPLGLSVEPTVTVQ